MKIKFMFSAIIISFVIIFSSCKKDEKDENNEVIIPVTEMQAIVDGSLVICDSLVFVREDFAGDLFGITGIRNDSTTFQITFPVALGAGTYTFLEFTPGSSFMNEAFFWNDNINQYHSVNGSLTVTSFSDKNIKGTFQFLGVNAAVPADSLDITLGEFDIDY